jgi:hypothetical protein
MYIYKTKTKTETKTKNREGGGRWVRREWGDGGEGKDMHLYYGISPYKRTIQFYHTRSPYNKNANFS